MNAPLSSLRTATNAYTKPAQKVSGEFRKAIEPIFKRHRKRFHPDDLTVMAMHELNLISCLESINLTIKSNS